MFKQQTPLRFKRLDPLAVLPVKASAGAAAFDFTSLENATLEAGRPVTLRTGFAVEVPPGFVMMVNSRSGHGFNHDVRLANSLGWIDSDYRGEVKVKLTADGRTSLRVKAGETRIAQFLLVSVLDIVPIEVDELSETARGAGGFGSTGG